jgi:hypothetical protein
MSHAKKERDFNKSWRSNADGQESQKDDSDKNDKNQKNTNEMDRLQAEIKVCENQKHGDVLLKKLIRIYELTWDVSLQTLDERAKIAIAKIKERQETLGMMDSTEIRQCPSCRYETLVCAWPKFLSGWGDCWTCEFEFDMSV